MSAFNFGTAKPFGTTTSATTGFGTSTAPTTAATGFGGIGFGQTAAPAGGTGFGFGATTTTAPNTGFGGAAPLGTGTGFGGTGTGFGGTGLGTGTGFGGTGLGTGTGGFGTGIGGTTGGFGTGLGTTGATLPTGGFGGAPSTGFGGGNTFNTGPTGGLAAGLANQQHAAQQQSAAQSLALMATAVSLPLIFGDEKDTIIAKWNQLQAFWGTGKGFYNQAGNSIHFNTDNPFCRFKAVGYSCLSKNKNEDGLVALILNKTLANVQSNQQLVVTTLHRLVGGGDSISVCVEDVKALPDNKTEVVIYIQERNNATGVVQRIPATRLSEALKGVQVAQQLQGHLGVENLFPKSGLSEEQLKTYLDTPPAGIDPIIWQQAKQDNPDLSKLIPVPMIGFQELQRRLKHQDQQTKLHQARLDMISEDINKLQQNHSNMLAKIEQYKRRHAELSHRTLQVMVKQEVQRKTGYAIQADEEQLRVQLDVIQAELNAPMQFKGRLNELMSQIRMQNQLGTSRMEASYQLEPSAQLEIRQHLLQQQEGLQHLISIIKEDLQDLHLIEQGLTDNRR